MDTVLSSVLNENVDRLFRELVVDRNNNKHVGQKLRFPRKRKLSVDEPYTRRRNLKEDFRSQRSFSITGETVESKPINGDLEIKPKGGNLYAVPFTEGCEDFRSERSLNISGEIVEKKPINGDLEIKPKGGNLNGIRNIASDESCRFGHLLSNSGEKVEGVNGDSEIKLNEGNLYAGPYIRDGDLKEDFKPQRSFSTGISGKNVESKTINGNSEIALKEGNLYPIRNVASNVGCRLQHVFSNSGDEMGKKTINNVVERKLQGEKLCTTGKFVTNGTESESENIRNNVCETKAILFPCEVVPDLKYNTARENEGLQVQGMDSFPKVENWCSKNTMHTDLMDKLYSDFMNGVHLKSKLKRPKSKRLRHSEGTSCDQLDYHGNKLENKRLSYSEGTSCDLLDYHGNKPKCKRLRHSEGTTCDQLDYHGNKPESKKLSYSEGTSCDKLYHHGNNPESKRLRHSERMPCDQLDYHGNNSYPGNCFVHTNLDASTKELSDHTVAMETIPLTVSKDKIVCDEVEKNNFCEPDIAKEFSKSGTANVLIMESQKEQLSSSKINKNVSVEPQDLVQDSQVQIDDKLLPVCVENSTDLSKKLSHHSTVTKDDEQVLGGAKNSIGSPNKSWNQDTGVGTSEKLNGANLSVYETETVIDLQLDKKKCENTTCNLLVDNDIVVENTTPCVGDTESVLPSDNNGGPEKVNDEQLNSLNTDKSNGMKKAKISSSKNGIKSQRNGLKDKIPKTKMTRNRLNSFNLMFPEPPPEGLWRSKRTRVPPLEGHKNERIIYDCGVVSGITISSEARIKQMEEQKALQRAKEKKEKKETLKKVDKRKHHRISERDNMNKSAGKSHTTKTNDKHMGTSRNRDKQLVRKIIKNSEKYLMKQGKSRKDCSQSIRRNSMNGSKFSEKSGLSRKASEKCDRLSKEPCNSYHNVGKSKLGLHTKKKSLEDKHKKTKSQSSDKDSKRRLSKMFENAMRKSQKDGDRIKKHHCSHKTQNCKCKHGQMERLVTKRENGVSSKKKDVIQMLNQEVILRSHEENVYSENGTDAFRTLSCLEDKDQIEAHDLELLMPSTESVKWSNGNRMFSSLGLFDTENKISHPGGIWKSVVQEQ